MKGPGVFPFPPWPFLPVKGGPKDGEFSPKEISPFLLIKGAPRAPQPPLGPLGPPGPPFLPQGAPKKLKVDPRLKPPLPPCPPWPGNSRPSLSFRPKIWEIPSFPAPGPLGTPGFPPGPKQRANQRPRPPGTGPLGAPPKEETRGFLWERNRGPGPPRNPNPGSYMRGYPLGSPITHPWELNPPGMKGPGPP